MSVDSSCMILRYFFLTLLEQHCIPARLTICVVDWLYEHLQLCQGCRLVCCAGLAICEDSYVILNSETEIL